MITRTANGCTVATWQIIGTKTRVFAAFVPSSYSGNHSTLMTIGGQCCGQVGSERLPAELDALKGEERFQRVRAWRGERQRIAHEAIVAAFPEARLGRPTMAEIEVTE